MTAPTSMGEYLPSPSSPYALRPQHIAAPPVVTAQLRSRPDVKLFGKSTLARDGRTYEGSFSTTARCGEKEVESTETVTFRVTKAKMASSDLVASAFEGTTFTDFRCFGDKVHAVSEISGALD